MKHISMWLIAGAAMAFVACDSDSQETPPSELGNQPTLERGRLPAESSEQATGTTGGSGPTPVVTPEPTPTVPAQPPAASLSMNTPPAQPPVVTQPPAAVPPVVTQPPAQPPVITPPLPVVTQPPVVIAPPAPLTPPASACDGTNEGASCGVAICEGQTHMVEKRCDSRAQCVEQKVKCDDSCKAGACVAEKPGNGDKKKD